MGFRVRHTLRNGLALCGETRGARVQQARWRHCRRCAVRLDSEEAARRRKTGNVPRPSPLSSDKALDEYLEELAEEEHSGR